MAGETRKEKGGDQLNALSQTLTALSPHKSPPPLEFTVRKAFYPQIPLKGNGDAC